MESFDLDTPAGTVPARLEGDGDVALLLATGAGTGQDHPGVAGLRSRLVAAGLTVMTFEYAYRAAGRPFPDPPARLLAVHRAAMERLRRISGAEPVLAGRSMGGRMSTMLAAEGGPCRAIVCYGYPLHPAGRPERLRVEHLGDVRVPMLFVTGTRDALALPELVQSHLKPLPGATLELIEGADHSFRKKGAAAGEMLDLLAVVTVNWLGRLPGLAGRPEKQA